jgi:hypothetical protein
MKLKKTMQEWGQLVFETFPKSDALRHLDDALHDLGVMFNENARLTAQLAEREEIARELAEAIKEHIASYDVGAHFFDDALARFHAAEGDDARRALGGEG